MSGLKIIVLFLVLALVIGLKRLSGSIKKDVVKKKQSVNLK